MVCSIESDELREVWEVWEEGEVWEVWGEGENLTIKISLTETKGFKLPFSGG
ncbi:MAG: hypothetical protein AB4058_10255 [Microcystaceae cyanobacterium]